MKLLDLTWFPYRVPFRAAFHTAHGALSQRSGALVAVQASAGATGYGEIAPLPSHSGLSLGESLRPLPELARALRGRELPDILRFLALQSAEEQMPPALICGLETALLDAWGQASGLRVADLLLQLQEDTCGQGGSPTEPREHVAINAVISGARTEDIIASALAALAQGFTCLKLKLVKASPAALARVAALRAAIGPAPHLRLDANEGWSLTQARELLAQCAPYAIEYVEQPLPAHDLRGMAELRRVSPVPLAADEAVSGLASVQHILQAEAADVLILKPQLAGGLHACQRIIQAARARGVSCVITSTMETGIGVAAALHLAAASPAVSQSCGLATLPLLEHDLLTARLPIQQGTLQLPLAPGLGVRPDQAALARFRSQTDES